MALIVSIAHAIGMQRQSTYDTMPAYQSQLYCRTWWAIYVLDRRIAIESGQPYLIQDRNTDTVLPLDLSDEWMTRFATRTETTAELRSETETELVRDLPPSPIPYLVAMVRYSRVAGKVWEVLYGVKATNTASSAMVEYADLVLCKLLDNTPRDLQYDPGIPSETQFSLRLKWQVKQSVLLFTVRAV